MEDSVERSSIIGADWHERSIPRNGHGRRTRADEIPRRTFVSDERLEPSTMLKIDLRWREN